LSNIIVSPAFAVNTAFVSSATELTLIGSAAEAADMLNDATP
jgi:hypothetical protein